MNPEVEEESNPKDAGRVRCRDVCQDAGRMRMRAAGRRAAIIARRRRKGKKRRARIRKHKDIMYSEGKQDEGEDEGGGAGS